MLERKNVKHDKFDTTVVYEITHQHPTTMNVLSEDVLFKINNYTGEVEVVMSITDLKAPNPEQAKLKLIDWLERLAKGLKDDNLIRVTI